jgi:hypothetical protein
MVEWFGEEVTVRVPSLGMTGSLLGILLAGAFFDLVGMVALVIFLQKLVAKPNNFSQYGGLLLFVAVFGGVGLALILASLNMAKRQAALAVTDGVLMALQTGLFGSRQREWQPGEVQTVRVGPSGLEINNKPVMELQIVDAHGRKFSMLAGHREEDLVWLAQTLSRSLKLPPPASDDDLDDADWEDEEE